MPIKNQNRSRKPSPTGELVGVDVPRIVRGLSARETKRIAKKKALSHVLHLVRDWQTDGMPSSDNGIEPDADEVWIVVEWLQKRIRRYSAND